MEEKRIIAFVNAFIQRWKLPLREIKATPKLRIRGKTYRVIAVWQGKDEQIVLARRVRKSDSLYAIRLIGCLISPQNSPTDVIPVTSWRALIRHIPNLQGGLFGIIHFLLTVSYHDAISVIFYAVGTSMLVVGSSDEFYILEGGKFNHKLMSSLSDFVAYERALKFYKNLERGAMLL